MYGPTRVHGAGLGLRRAHLGPLLDRIPAPIGFMEVAPEGWLGIGGRLGRAFHSLSSRIPIACHGLNLNLGGPDPLDENFLLRLKRFLDEHRIPVYSDHLTWCGDGGLLYELLPMPFTAEAITHVAGRIRRVQEILERRIAVENASYYVAPLRELGEAEFVAGILAEAGCDLLLDLNNVYVNSVNHGYDPRAFIAALPGGRIAYAHIAGHLRVRDDLAIDTHGAPVIDPVWDLLEHAYRLYGPFPTLLERDENIPALAECVAEVEHIARLQARYAAPAAAAANG